MDRLVDAVAEYLCRHRSVGLLRLTLDLTRRRLDIFAEIGAAEVIKGAAAPPAPEAWRTAAREGAGSIREGGSQLVRPVEKARRPSAPPAA